jgi:hypothetical protein
MRLKQFGALCATVLLWLLCAVAQEDRKPSPSKRSEAKAPEMTGDVRQAIEWERAKDRAAARQAAIEAGKGRAERTAGRAIDEPDSGRKTKDAKAPGAKKDH